MAADTYSVKWLIPSPMLYCLHVVLAIYQPSLQPGHFGGLGAGFSHNRINFLLPGPKSSTSKKGTVCARQEPDLPTLGLHPAQNSLP